MSVTRVPLRPIQKGSLTKLWVGVGMAVLVAAGASWAGMQSLPQTPAGFLESNADEEGVVTTESGLQIKELTKGEGASPGDADVVLIGYEGRLLDGTVFDQNPRTGMPVSGSIPGFSEGLKRMQRGGKYQLWIPPELGYGDRDVPDPQTGDVVIPANSVLVFEVQLLDFKTAAELQEMQRQMQQGMPPAP